MLIKTETQSRRSLQFNIVDERVHPNKKTKKYMLNATYTKQNDKVLCLPHLFDW